jgi:hypothetical protein
MLTPDLFQQENQKIRDVLEESNDYLERILDTLVSSLDFTKESERQAAIRAENAELATIEAIREARDTSLGGVDTVNVDNAAEQAGTTLGRSLSDRFRTPDFTNRFKTGLSAGLAGLGSRLLRGGPLIAIGAAFGDEIAKFLSENVGDMLEDAGFTESTVTAVEESLEKYTAPAIAGAGVGMIFKRTPAGALAGIILKRLGLTQEDFISTAETISNKIQEQLDFEMPTPQQVGGFLEQGATGAGIGYLGSLLLGRFKIPLTIAGFIADYLGLDTEKLNLFAEETAGQVSNLLQPPGSESPDYSMLNVQRDAASNLQLPSGQEVRRPLTRAQLKATPTQQGDGSLYDRLSLYQRIKGIGPLQTDVSQAFDAAQELQIDYLANPIFDPNGLQTVERPILLSASSNLNKKIGLIDDFLNMDPEIQQVFATTEQLQYLQQVRDISEQMRMAMNREQSQLNRPIDVMVRQMEAERETQGRSEAPQGYQNETGVQPIQVNPIVGQNEVSQISRNIATSSSVSILQPVVNNFNSVDNSTNVQGGGSGSAPAQLPAGAPKDYDRSLMG